MERIEMIASQLASVSPEAAVIDAGAKSREALAIMRNLVEASANGHAPSTAYLEANMPGYLRELAKMVRNLETGQRLLLAGAPLRLVP